MFPPEKVPESHRRRAASVSLQHDCNAETSSGGLPGSCEAIEMCFSFNISLLLQPLFSLVTSLAHDDQSLKCPAGLKPVCTTRTSPTGLFLTRFLFLFISNIVQFSLIVNVAEIAQRPLYCTWKQQYIFVFNVKFLPENDTIIKLISVRAYADIYAGSLWLPITHAFQIAIKISSIATTLKKNVLHLLNSLDLTTSHAVHWADQIGIKLQASSCKSGHQVWSFCVSSFKFSAFSCAHLTNSPCFDCLRRVLMKYLCRPKQSPPPNPWVSDHRRSHCLCFQNVIFTRRHLHHHVLLNLK